MNKVLIEQDRIFAERITNEFGIPSQYLTNIISDLRAWKNVVPEKKNFESVERKKHEHHLKILNSPVTTIHIETEGGIIHLSENDPLFHFFNRSITLFKQNFYKEMDNADKQWTKYINTWIERQIFRYFIYYFKNHYLVLFNQRAIIGLFLVHFGISLRKPIMTPDQWAINMGSADNYNDYLNNIVKYQHKKYIKELLH